jgi:hypothetical protein
MSGRNFMLKLDAFGNVVIGAGNHTPRMDELADRDHDCHFWQTTPTPSSTLATGIAFP